MTGMMLIILACLGPHPSWPVYGEYAGQNFVFDANVTGLAFVEEDTFRAEAINYFTQNFVELFGR